MVTTDKEINRIEPKNYIYLVPCYNESEEELTTSLNSLTLQKVVNNDNRCLLIICDGSAIGKGNKQTSTDKILKNMLKISNTDSGEYYDYKTWDNNQNIIKIHTGLYKYMNEVINFILIIKTTNYGKRDSLVLARKMVLNYNTHNNDNSNIIPFSVSESLFKYMFGLLKTIYDTNVDYIIGIDADTIFDYNCSYELIQCIEKDKNIHGCVGYVDILPTERTINMYSPFILYQYGEYMFSQCLRRYTQSIITQKVNCLSGCNQIIRVSKETCGNAILNILNYLPMEHENIFNHIRSYANHICHMLSMYPYVKSTQNLNAIAYTSVPTNFKVFMSQRRRWTLGAMTNDMMLTYLPNINIFERISAYINVVTYSLSPFIFVATVVFIKSIIEGPSMLMLYLSTIILIPLVYAFFIPIFIRPLSFRDSLYYYISYLFYIVCCSLVKLITYEYAILHMDVIKWGKTRANEEVANEVVETKNEVVANEVANTEITIC